MKVIAETSLAF